MESAEREVELTSVRIIGKEWQGWDYQKRKTQEAGWWALGMMGEYQSDPKFRQKLYSLTLTVHPLHPRV